MTFYNLDAPEKPTKQTNKQISYRIMEHTFDNCPLVYEKLLTLTVNPNQTKI